jgi:hypothetical protein
VRANGHNASKFFSEKHRLSFIRRHCGRFCRPPNSRRTAVNPTTVGDGHDGGPIRGRVSREPNHRVPPVLAHPYSPPAAVVGTLPDWEAAFGNVGWFLPPYIATGELSQLAAKIHSPGSLHSQDELETGLMMFYGPGSLAPMVMHRYTLAPIIRDFRDTIAEAVEAHFFGLHHIAVGGLMPVIEGAGRQLAKQRGLRLNSKGFRHACRGL